MFLGAAAFNSDISNWDVSSGTSFVSVLVFVSSCVPACFVAEVQATIATVCHFNHNKHEIMVLV